MVVEMVSKGACVLQFRRHAGYAVCSGDVARFRGRFELTVGAETFHVDRSGKRRWKALSMYKVQLTTELVEE